jgi:hypothetical protein
MALYKAALLLLNPVLMAYLHGKTNRYLVSLLKALAVGILLLQDLRSFNIQLFVISKVDLFFDLPRSNPRYFNAVKFCLFCGPVENYFFPPI